METIALFPLSSVLMPGARLPLQIFEPRYLDLVSDCMKQDKGFGVILLRAGSELLSKDSERSDARLAALGTYARIVDWDRLPDGKLGITIEGEKKFRLLSSSVEANLLHRGEVEWLVGFQLASFLAMFDCLLKFPLKGENPAQRQMRQHMLRILFQDLIEQRDRLFMLALVFELFRLVIFLCDLIHRS